MLFSASPIDLVVVSTLASIAQATWQLTSLVTHEMADATAVLSNTSLAFTLERGSVQTACSADWVQYPTAAVPTGWTKCEDVMLRFRIESFSSVSNFTLEVVEVDQTTGSTAVNVTRSTIAITSETVLPLTLTTAAVSWTPSAFDIYYVLTRNDGSDSGSTPCTEAFTFYITNPNVATLGSLTLGRGTETQWETDCNSNWNCGGADPSIGAWANCAASAFQFQKTLPTGGNQISDFDLVVKHTFPLLMATNIRGSDAPDYGLTNAEEAAGLEVVLTLGTSTWKSGGYLTAVESGGVDQTGNCELGCEFSSSTAVWVPVVSVEVI